MVVRFLSGRRIPPAAACIGHRHQLIFNFVPISNITGCYKQVYAQSQGTELFVAGGAGAGTCLIVLLIWTIENLLQVCCVGAFLSGTNN